MPAVKCIWFAGLALVLAAGVAGAALPDGVLHYTGRADELESGRLIYREQHYVRYRSNRAAERVVLYTCPNGAPFARKVLRYADAFAPDFELLDGRQGQHAGLHSGAGGREVFFREKSGAREARAAAPQGSGWVADAGFDEFVRANWAPLMRGEALPLQFLIPSRLELHRFQVKRLRAEVLDGVPAQVIRLRLSGWLGLILPHIDAWYSDPGHVLLRYEGLSNLMDADGDHYKVRIAFPTNERGPGDETAMAAARAAALRSCE